MLIIAAVLGMVGIGALLYFEAKIIGALVTGIAAIFFILSFIDTQEASTRQVKAVKQRDSAEFDRDFARASGLATKEESKILDDRVSAAIAKENIETANNDAAFAKAKESREILENKLSIDDDSTHVIDGSKPMKQLSKN